MIVVSIRHDVGGTETAEIGSYRKAILNGLLLSAWARLSDDGHLPQPHRADRSGERAPRLCGRKDGSSYAYARVILSTVSGQPVLHGIFDGSCYAG